MSLTTRILRPAAIELTLEAEKHLRIEPGMIWLSVGCGTGEMEEYLARKYGGMVYGIDIDHEAICLARQKELPNLKFQIGDGRGLAFADESVDIVYASGSLASFYHEGVREIARVLKTGGQAIVIETTFREGAIPLAVVEKWSERRSSRDWKLLTAEYVARTFREGYLSLKFSRFYQDSNWWDSSIEELKDNSGSQSHDDLLLKHYQDNTGISLFVFQKLPAFMGDL